MTPINMKPRYLITCIVASALSAAAWAETTEQLLERGAYENSIKDMWWYNMATPEELKVLNSRAFYLDQLKKDWIKEYTAAAPETARAKPAAPRKVLVYTSDNIHGTSIVAMLVSLRAMAAKTNAFQLDETVDYHDLLNRELLDRYDAVAINIWPAVCLPKPFAERLKKENPQMMAEKVISVPGPAYLDRETGEKIGKTLQEYVASGKGIFLYHLTVYAEPMAWAGAVFRGHLPGDWELSTKPYQLKVLEPANPLCAAFSGTDHWSIEDEIYLFNGTFNRNKDCRTLMAIDIAKTREVCLAKADADTQMRPVYEEALKNNTANKADTFNKIWPLLLNDAWGKVNPNDAKLCPVLWIKNEGKGRVFYTTFGHNRNVMRRPEVQKLYLDGLQFAIGDLPADATPSQGN